MYVAFFRGLSCEQLWLIFGVPPRSMETEAGGCIAASWSGTQTATSPGDGGIH